MATISVDTTAKDYDSIIDSLIAFASIQYGEQASVQRVWSDFNVSAFSRNWAELVAYMGDQLMFYMDSQANQAYLRSATIPSFVLDIAQQLGYEVPTQQSASGKVQFTTTGPATIPAGYQVLSGTTKYFTTRAISTNQADTVEVEAIQGEQRAETYSAEGLQNESFILLEPSIIIDLDNPNPELRSPIVRVNGTDYSVVLTPVDAAANSNIVVRKLLADGTTQLTFGDGIFGRRLVENETISISYRIGGGSVGNTEPNTITTLSTQIPNVASVTNSAKFTGGVDQLSLQQIKDRVPLSLSTKVGAVSLDDYADILVANFPQVLTAKAAINTTDRGIDLNIYVIPQADTVTNITDNSLLLDNLTDYVERRKVVGTKFLIKDGEEIYPAMDIEVVLNRDASKAAVESDIRERLAALFDLRSGGTDGTGVRFQQLIKVSDVFDILKAINGISRFEIKKHTVIPRVEEIVSSPNQDFYVSKVDVYESVGINEWLVATSDLSNPEPLTGQVPFKVFKRTLGTVTSLNEDSVTDTGLDLTVRTGNAIVINNTLLTDPANVFTPGQYDGYLVVDSNNHIWTISQTRSSSLVISSPALTDAAVTTVANGAYRVVKSFAGQMIGIGGESFSILYNTHNTFFSQGASFNLIATIRSAFILSEEQINTGTYGVAVSIGSVAALGPNPGDLVNIGFNGNPNLSAVTTDYSLVDSTGEVFEIANISNDDSTVAAYNNPSAIDGAVILTNTGADQSVSIPFFAGKEVSDSFLVVTTYLEKTNNPLGAIQVEIYSDNAGSPDSVLYTSNTVDCSTLAAAGMAAVQFNFPTSVDLTLGEKYHLAVRGDNAYKISYNNGDGSVSVGLDQTTLGYSPATTATGYIRLESAALDVLAKASGTIQIADNFIRATKQASMLVKLLNNSDFGTGTNRITIGGQPFTAVTGSPAPSGEFQVGASITDTRNNLLAAINAQIPSQVAASSVGSDSFLLTANASNFKGAAGNSIAVSVIDAGVQNFEIYGLTSLVGGIDGDKVILNAPAFLNSTSVAYTYNTNTGIIQFASAVSLPTFESTMKFKDGAGILHDVLAVDNSSDTVTLNTGLSVNNTVTTVEHGSIYRDYVYEFGTDVAVGASANATATNLATVIDANGFVAASALTNTVTVQADILGTIGNNYGLRVEDDGASNFVLSGDKLAGGLNGDIVAVDNVQLAATLSSPSTGEFQVDPFSLANTLANLQLSINTHPSLTGVVIASINVPARRVEVASATAGVIGNSIPLSLVANSSGELSISGATLEGGSDNLQVASYNGAVWTAYSPDSDMIFLIGVAVDTLAVVAKSDALGNQVLPQISLNGNFDAGLGRRYYSDDNEVSFLIATRSPNSFILGAEQVNIFGEGIVSGEGGVRVDQFIFRTSKIDDDVTNLRENEIPVLDQANLTLNLLGGVN